MLEDKLYWHKFRPNTINNEKGKIKMILLPRIKKLVEKDYLLNFLFYGSPGQGKTTISKILTEDTDCLKINCRLDSLEKVRDSVEEHCKHYGIFSGENKQKVVWLEEFDGSSWQMREALRPMIELYDSVKFIATANSIANFNNEKDHAVLSRFSLVKFDPIDDKEREFLKNSQIKFLKSLSNLEKIDIANDDIIKKIINHNFPDFRKSVQQLQELKISGDVSDWETKLTSNNEQLYNYMLDGKNNYIENYYLVMDNYKDNTQELLNILSRPFIKFLIERHPKKFENSAKHLIKSSKTHNAEYLSTMDPEIHLYHYITELKEILK
jgi:replication-associated recombination protein RarA